MIPMSCPSCGRRGNVPLDRLNTRMHCKKCDAVFHLDATGKPTLGEPPSAKGAKGKGARDKNEPLDPIGILAAKLAKTPKPVWMGLLGLIGLYALYVAWGVAGPGPRTAEGEFAERNLAAASAFVDGDVDTLKKMATEDSREEIAKVVETFRPLVGDAGGKTTSDKMQPVASILPEQMTDEPAIEVSIQPPSESEEGSAPPIFILDLVWIKGNNRYYLNGKATLEANEVREKNRKAMKEADEKRRKKGSK